MTYNVSSGMLNTTIPYLPSCPLHSTLPLRWESAPLNLATGLSGERCKLPQREAAAAITIEVYFEQWSVSCGDDFGNFLCIPRCCNWIVYFPGEDKCSLLPCLRAGAHSYQSTRCVMMSYWILRLLVHVAVADSRLVTSYTESFIIIIIIIKEKIKVT